MIDIAHLFNTAEHEMAALCGPVFGSYSVYAFVANTLADLYQSGRCQRASVQTREPTPLVILF
jgi:hypothetical protein